MTDTDSHMRKKQAEIMLAMTPYERFMQGAEMIDYVRMVVENSIKAKYPDISPIDLKIEVFKRYYGHELSQERITEFISLLKKQYQQKDLTTLS